MSRKVAVVLFNLGGPDSQEAIAPFLMNFFTDPNIIRVPMPFRWLIAKLISRRRSRREAGDSYGLLGNVSPLLANSRVQAEALEENLNTSPRRRPGSSDSTEKDSGFRRNDDASVYKTFVCMRYWHPMADEIAAQVKAWGAEEIVLLPLYPQFSTTTTWSSLGVWRRAVRKVGLNTPSSMICCYPFEGGFIQASAENILVAYRQALQDGHKAPRILFSAHGLPESVVKGGDPYQWQCEQTAEKIAAQLAVILSEAKDPGIEAPDPSALRPQDDSKKLDWRICYQSRVGPMKWIGPSTEEELERAARDNTAVIIYPHAFTQEHVETLVELDIEYRHKAEAMGLPGYYRAATAGTHPAFIDGLATLVRDHQGRRDVAAEGGACLCPAQYNRCCMRDFKTLD